MVRAANVAPGYTDFLVRRGLATFLRVFDDLALAEEAGSASEAVELCASLYPVVVLSA